MAILCDVKNLCGGCDYTDISYNEELHEKRNMNYSYKSIDRVTKRLNYFAYIERSNPNNNHSSWRILRNINDSITRYTEDEDGIHII